MDYDCPFNAKKINERGQYLNNGLDLKQLNIDLKPRKRKDKPQYVKLMKYAEFLKCIDDLSIIFCRIREGKWEELHFTQDYTFSSK